MVGVDQEGAGPVGPEVSESLVVGSGPALDAIGGKFEGEARVVGQGEGGDGLLPALAQESAGGAELGGDQGDQSMAEGARPITS